MTRHLLLVALVATAAACDLTDVQYTRLGPPSRAPHVAAKDVRLYFTPPPCEYQQLGLVEAERGTTAQELRAMQGVAARAGGNAVIFTSKTETPTQLAVREGVVARLPDDCGASFAVHDDGVNLR